MNYHCYLLIGKILEALGAALVAWVAVQACYIEVRISEPVHIDDINKDDDLDVARGKIDKINERRRRQFGYWESISVAVGTALIFGGCVFYLIGLFLEPIGR